MKDLWEIVRRVFGIPFIALGILFISIGEVISGERVV